MAKSIQFNLEGRSITGTLGTRISKRDLYGYAKRTVEQEGQTLTRGYLSADGRLMANRELSSVRLDPEGTPVADPITEIEGEPAELHPSSFDQENSLEPVPWQRLIGFNVSDVYPLEELDLPEGVYETWFSYRKSYQPKEALILVKQNGEAFLLTGVTKRTTLVGLMVAYEFFDAEDELEADEDELDFSMI